MRQCTIPQHPPTQTIDVTHRHSGAPSSIEPLTIPILRPVPCAAYPISPAICVHPDFKVVGVGDFPASWILQRTPDAQHVPLVVLSVLLRASANALIQGLPFLPFPPSTGLSFNWVTGVPLE